MKSVSVPEPKVMVVVVPPASLEKTKLPVAPNEESTAMVMKPVLKLWV